MAAEEKLDKLETRLRELGAAVVAFSGGVDSSFLLAVGRCVLGQKVLAVTAASPIHPHWEKAEAETLAKRLDVEHIVIETEEMDDPHFRANPPERCYHCKRVLARQLQTLAAARGIPHILVGGHADDRGDFRPGARAAREAGLLEPLAEVGLTKAEIRQLAREMGLPNWDRPAMACLASRIPYGASITPENLKQVEDAEELLRGMGFRQSRVRHHGNLARIELEPGDIERAATMRERIVAGIKALGFAYVALDLQGYRAGSMNEPLALNIKSCRGD